MNEDMQERIEEAAEAPGHVFKGQRLQHFSFSRQACWQRCGYERLESTFESGVAIVYICTLGEELADGKLSGIDLISSARNSSIPAFRARAEAWADALGLTANNPDGIEAKRLGIKIFNETHESRFRPVPNGGGTPSPNA